VTGPLSGAQLIAKRALRWAKGQIEAVARCGAPGLSRSLAAMTTSTTITYETRQAQADDLRGPDRMPRSTRVRSTGASRRIALARRVRLRLRLA